MNKKTTQTWAEYGSLISFVPAKGHTTTETEDETSKQNDECKLSGKEAKTFYEDLLNDTSNVSAKEGIRKRKKKKKALQEDSCQKQEASKLTNHDCKVVNSIDVCKSALSGSKQCTTKHSNGDKEEKQMLFHSQTGDLKMLIKLFRNSPNININYQDSFGWTALMCAAVSGHTQVVDYLLEQGANRSICDSQNQTVCELTVAKGNKSMRDRIKHFVQKTDGDKDGEKKETFFCDKCKTIFKETTLKDHQTSTLHLFNMNLKPNVNTFMIPRSNIGYRIMKQSGWDGEHGLGPQGKGHRLPVKTVLKRNRYCLGSNYESKEKITHFGPYDTSAIASINSGSKRVVSAATSSRRERRKRERKEKEWERNLRESMDF